MGKRVVSVYLVAPQTPHHCCYNFPGVLGHVIYPAGRSPPWEDKFLTPTLQVVPEEVVLPAWPEVSQLLQAGLRP